MKKPKPTTTKVFIEFSPGEVESLKNFTKVMKPEEVSLDDFYKQIFLLGAQFMNNTLTKMVEEAKMEAQARSESNVDEQGDQTPDNLDKNDSSSE